MKKGKRLSKADALRVLRRAYDLIKNDNYTFMCRAIEKAAVELSLAEKIMCGVLSYTRTEDVQTCKQKK